MLWRLSGCQLLPLLVLPERLSRYMTLCLFIPPAFLSVEELTSRLPYGN
ncbi:Uncharacterised protein [Klebsiella pneumoniae]|nr:Uncharacterised protein [Klebsiella pneumoniae]